MIDLKEQHPRWAAINKQWETASNVYHDARLILTRHFEFGDPYWRYVNTMAVACVLSFGAEYAYRER